MHPGFHVLLPSFLLLSSSTPPPSLGLDHLKNMIMSLSCLSRKQCHHIVLKIRLSLFGLPCSAPQEHTLLTFLFHPPHLFLHISSCPACLSGLCFLLSLDITTCFLLVCATSSLSVCLSAFCLTQFYYSVFRYPCKTHFQFFPKLMCIEHLLYDAQWLAIYMDYLILFFSRIQRDGN